VGFRLTPQDPSFFELFAASARQLVDGSRELTTLLGADQAEREVILDRMHEIESAADEATHEIVRRVNGAFVTPFDRADMHGLAVALDRCVDLMEAAVDLIVLYQVDELMPRVAKQVEVISRMAELTADAMPRLRSMRELNGYWIEINRLEHRANKQYRRMLAELFNDKKPDPVTVMKHKDIIDALEATANGFEQVALKVEAIAVRES
jgi:predicted phosphate transport protein (TIGR00153 family)